MQYLRKGFTLIELLIVIAILGTLAVVVLIALNPVQQLARARDSGRASTVAQLGHAVEAYATTHGGYYPTTTTCGVNWITTCLVNSGEIQTVPALVPYTAGGTSCGGQNGFCYTPAAGAQPSSAVIYAAAEAQSNTSKCGSGAPGCGAGAAYFVYSTAAGRGGLVCGVPTPGVTTFCGG